MGRGTTSVAQVTLAAGLPTTHQEAIAAGSASIIGAGAARCFRVSPRRVAAGEYG